MGKFVLALACTFALVGHAVGDEFLAIITNIEGNTVIFQKGTGFGGKKVKQEVAVVAPNNLKVFKGEIDGKKVGEKAGFIIKTGDQIKSGLSDEFFTKTDNKKGIAAQFTTNDRGQITKIVVVDYVTLYPSKK